MESNGVGGRIHCSQETAEALTEMGKETWVTPREDKVYAKGKGELQTYWVLPRGKAGSAYSHSNTFVSETTGSDNRESSQHIPSIDADDGDAEMLEKRLERWATRKE